MSTKIGLEWFSVSAVIPVTAMILGGHIWSAAGTIGALLVATVVIVRIERKSARDRDRELLAYASTAASLGTDPAPVIKAMRAGEDQPEDVVEEARSPLLHLPRRRW